MEIGSYLNSAGVWLETPGRVLSGHPTLYGAAVEVNAVLDKVKVLQRSPFCYFDLRLNQIHPETTQHVHVLI